MNHNSFPSGEQVSTRSDDSSQEYPSFEEHMESIEKDNTAALTKPSLKNIELKGGNRFEPAVEKVSKKIKAGEKLETTDIYDMAKYKFNINAEGLNDYLSNIGFENGTDFDVKLPGKIITTDGRREELPLSISFNNGRDFTRIDINRDQDGKTTINSYSGNREDGVDVGYEGPVRADYRPRDFQSTKFE